MKKVKTIWKSLSPFMVSLFLHVIPLIGFISFGAGTGNSDKETMDVTIVESSPVAPGQEPEKGPGESQPKGKPNQDCDNWFGGIGIQTNPIDQSIDIVYKGYPAEAAGLLPGDIYEVVGGGDIRGEVGTMVTLVVVRGYNRLTFNIIRGKICYEN